MRQRILVIDNLGWALDRDGDRSARDGRCSDIERVHLIWRQIDAAVIIIMLILPIMLVIILVTFVGPVPLRL
ncbi:hypothetical protein AUC71_01605 [Methyloceanibacter marginalis]|uniref:Uncharacterized protein n=1 Tax=Methyloceanibacter marginalis TaxID=1774971 RepID=A0A1E3W9Y2_9HYPH|nr:hypothetical protein AUC71_01605 [Methyloceanibacter marginalis]